MSPFEFNKPKEKKPWKFPGKPYKIPGRAGTHKPEKGKGSYTRKPKHRKPL